MNDQWCDVIVTNDAASVGPAERLYNLMWSAIALTVAVVVMLFCSAAAMADEEQVSDNEQVEQEEWMTRDCLLEPHIVVELSSPVKGVISSIKVDRGDRVRKGSLVVQLRSDEERAIINLNKAEVEFGEQTVTRNHELYRQNLISAQELDELKLKSELARLQLAVARTRLSQKRITSPVSGVVIDRMMDPGEYVNELPFLKIASLNPIHVEAVLPKELFGSIKPDMEADVTLEEPIGGTYKASVSVVDRVIDAASGTFGIRLVLPNPDNKIPAGLKCSMSIWQ
ncbi:MAG: efflux RND transporter periplasmic adaptor subunit [Candidatus Sedimenticola sp. PURPLELP]